MIRLLVFCGLVVFLCAATSAAQTRPNVLLIITDDAGYADFGSYGATDIRTPNIDSLAKAGTRFTDYYAAPTCTPTRAALITGRYQQRVALEVPLGNASTPARDQGLPARGYSLPQLLKNSGYSTALIGKWHLGYRPEFGPNAHGFDYFFGHLSGYVDFYQHTGGDGVHDLYENGEPVHADGYMTDMITERSVKFIEEHAGRPFFLEVAYNAPHWPFQVPGKPSVAPGHARLVHPADENTSSRADYAAMVEHVDHGVGQLLATLDRLGLAGETLVIFTNDNGGEWLSDNGPLFHRKGTIWEGGIRVPLIMRWPGRIPAGGTTSQVGMVMDLTATILAATKAPVPAEARLEGVDLLPLVQPNAKPVERTIFFRLTARQQRAVRQGDWKVMVEANHTMLFNVAADPGERNDVAKERPDIVRRLFPLIAAWGRDVDAEAKASAPVRVAPR